MKRFIFEERNGVYIIDLAKTLQQIRLAVEVIKDVVADHKSILIVGTKKQAKGLVRELAELCGEFYVCERWLGGMLTNLPTLMQSMRKLERIEKRIAAGGDGLTKKELSLLGKEQIKLDKNLSGLRGMRKVPGLLIVVDTNKEHLAVAEAKKLGIPVIGLVDTNCDPDPIDYVVACNDDALKSVKIILQALVQGIIEKKNELNISMVKEGLEQVTNAEIQYAATGTEESMMKEKFAGSEVKNG
jgi:small subunit ribosomal protein S2